jgi:hypothetical protein
MIDPFFFVEALPGGKYGVVNADTNKVMFTYSKWSDANATAIKMNSQRKQNPAGLSLTQKIKRMGGIDIGAIRDISGERKAGKGIAGISPGLFTRNGRGLDDLAISLNDAGYSISVNDADGGVADLAEMIRTEIDGYQKFYPGDQSESFEKQYADYYGGAPAAKKRKAAKTRHKAPRTKAKRRPSFDLADRVSQITGRPPSRRLVARRMKNNQRGFFPNPVPASKKVQVRNASDLYTRFTGHEATEYELVDKPVIPDVMLQVGDIDGVLYTTVRDGKTEKYIHKFKKNCRPLFCVSHDGKQLYMLGGSYDFTELGIVDKT